jgi:hypothetical protein
MTSEEEHVILTTLYLASAKNIKSWRARKVDLQRTFPLGIPTVPSSAFIATTSDECLSCDGFSPGETICFGTPNFITD